MLHIRKKIISLNYIYGETIALSCLIILWEGMIVARSVSVIQFPFLFFFILIYYCYINLSFAWSVKKYAGAGAVIPTLCRHELKLLCIHFYMNHVYVGFHVSLCGFTWSFRVLFRARLRTPKWHADPFEQHWYKEIKWGHAAFKGVHRPTARKCIYLMFVS